MASSRVLQWNRWKVLKPMDSEQLKEHGHRMVDFIADYYKTIEDFPVLSQVQPGYLHKLLPDSAPDHPETLDQVLDDVRAKILPGVTHWQSPTFFAYYPSNSSVAKLKSLVIFAMGEDGDIPSGGYYSSEPSQSLVSDSNTVRATINTAPEFEQPGQENLFMSVDDLMIPMNEQEKDLSPWDVLDPDMFFSDNNNSSVQPQAPHLAPTDDEFLGGLRHVDRGQVEYLFANEQFKISRLTTSMQENRNDHRPKKALSGIILDYSSDTDSDAESISATVKHITLAGFHWQHQIGFTNHQNLNPLMKFDRKRDKAD